MAWRTNGHNTGARRRWTRSRSPRKIPAHRIAKPTEWTQIGTACEPQVYAPVVDCNQVDPDSPGSFHVIDIIPPTAAGDAEDIINLHRLELDIHLERDLADPSTCQPLNWWATASGSSHVRWVMKRLGINEPGYTLNPWSAGAIGVRANDRGTSVLDYGESIVTPRYGRIANIENTVGAIGDCLDVGLGSAYPPEAGNLDGWTTSYAEVTPRHHIRLRRTFRIPMQFKEQDGLFLAIGMKSWYGIQSFGFSWTAFGRLRISRS